MKKIISILIAALPLALFAQTAERQVIGSAGGYTTTSSVQVSNTIGETVVATGTSNNLLLTQGFQQPNSGTVGIDDITTGLAVKVYPNPVKDIVTLNLTTPTAMQLTITVTDISGRQTAIPVQKLQVNGAITQALDFSMLQAGNYLVQLQNNSGTLKQMIKVQKVD